MAQAIRALGFDWNPQLNANHAMALVVMAATWKQISYNFLFFLAGLQSIPKSVIEAAAIDGARPVRRFWTVIFPLLSPTTFFLLVVNIVYVFFDTFGIIDSVTGGGPPRAPRRWSTRSSPTAASAATRRLGRPQSVVLMVLVIGCYRHPVPLHRAQGPVLMVERKSFSFVPHVILALGILVVAFPVYVAFVASTWDPRPFPTAPCR